MPRRSDIKNILIIGSGPIIIGQACEFDYSGTQACKALKEEGYRIVLVNSNPATIMTDPHIADATYIEPITIQLIERVIEKERIDALLPTMGGQVALNLAMELYNSGFLEKMGVVMIGAAPETISRTENRFEFYQLMQKHSLPCPQGFKISNLEEAKNVLTCLPLPVIVRSSFTLGGEGSGIIRTSEEAESIITQALEASPIHQAFIEEAVCGWKEFEMEVMKDNLDNCVIVCSIENIDPMGIHTGDSITVSPALTLTDKEYQVMRNAAFKVMRVTGIEAGGANVQFAIHPKTGRMVVIEMNPRVSRSSAFASKATGFPIAKVAAKLAVGYTLDEIPNEITNENSAAFEPSIDYIAVKLPRFDFEKFKENTPILGTSMQSVGEVMAIGRTFKESFQKAIHSLERNLTGFEEIKFFTKNRLIQKRIIKDSLKVSHPERYLYIAEAYRQGLSENTIHNLCQWDPWFLRQIQEIVETEKNIQEQACNLEPDFLRYIKTLGFSNQRISELSGLSFKCIEEKQKKYDILPIYRRIDTCAAEFSSSTSYLYSTYLNYSSSEESCEANPSNCQKVIIIGSGPNHISQGIEFDYCSVHAAMAAKALGYEVIMINCNPGAVSTDHTIADRLYFSPLIKEDIWNIVECESRRGQLIGVFVQFGGQTAIKLAHALSYKSIPILGTTLDSIDIAEDRQRCRELIMKDKLLQPMNDIALTPKDLLEKSQAIGFPVILRPSYVIGGQFMEIVYNQKKLKESRVFKISNQGRTILVEEFLENALEIEVDAISDGKEVYIAGIMEHFEKAGIHSGDSTGILPSQNLTQEIMQQLHHHTINLSQQLQIKGLINIQFAFQNKKLYLIEINPRASRTIPFISKATNIPLAFIAAQVMLGVPLSNFKLGSLFSMDGIAIKKPIFSFQRFFGVDPLLGPEMRSTGEMMIQGVDLNDVSLKLFYNFYNLFERKQNKILIITNKKSLDLSLKMARDLEGFGFEIQSNVFSKGNTICIDNNFIKDAISDISRGVIKFVINLTDDKTEHVVFRKVLLKTRTPEFKTTFEVKFLVKSLRNAKLSSSLFSLQEKNSQHLKITYFRNINTNVKNR